MAIISNKLNSIIVEQEPLSVYGSAGFVGSHYVANTNINSINIPRDVRESQTPSILYFIGTVDNYNVLTDPYLDINTNETLLIETLEACRKRWGNFVFNFVSTWFVYGTTNLPYKEDYPCSPKGFYSITKYAAEMLLRSYCETYNCNYRIIRLGNVLGPNDRKASKKKNAIQFMLRNLRENEDVFLYEGGQIIRDLIHVKDMVRGLDLILRKGSLNEIYNLSSGCPTIVGDLIKDYGAYIKSRSKIIEVETPHFHKVVQVKDCLLDVSKVRSLGFEPSIKFTHEILDTL